MMVVPAARDWLLLLRQHRTASASAFAAGVLLFLAVAAGWPKQYRASTLLSVNPAAVAPPVSGNGPSAAPPLAKPAPALPTHDGQSEAVATLLRQKAMRADWAAIASRFHLYPDMVAGSGLPKTAQYLASQVAFRPVVGGRDEVAAVRIGYEAPDREVALGVVDAVANDIAGSSVGRGAPRAAAVSKSAKLDPLYAPVVLPVVAAPRHDPARQDPKPNPELSRRLQASLAAGADLQRAFDQNAITLNQLHQELLKDQARQAAPTPAPAPKKAPEDPQLERLRQQLVQEQKNLADLEHRYTDQYPDVVAARERVHDVQLDISRIAAADAQAARSAPVAAPPPVAPAIPAAELQSILKQVSQAGTAHDTLQQAIDRNRERTAQLRAQIESQKSAAGAQAGREYATSGLDSAAGSSLGDAASTSPAHGASAIARAPGALPAGPTAAGEPAPQPLFLPEAATVAASPFPFAYPFSLVFGFAFGGMTALAAAWAAERRNPSIRNERMLRRVLPNSAVYLGGIPRIRHEVIVE